MSIVCINSTVAARRQMRRDGQIAPIHYWGYRPMGGDVLLAHRLNRYEIVLRAKLGGLDSMVFFRTCWHLGRGANGVYLVTQPDLWQALPLLRRLFPTRRFVTWAWMDWEVDRHLSRLRVCDHILCLTQGAKRRLDELGLATRSSLAIWGCDPAHYRTDVSVRCDIDVLMAGLTARDTDLVKRTINLGRFSVLLSHSSCTALGLASAATTPQVTTIEIDTENAMVTAFHRCRVTWIPLKPNDPYPSGYTNAVESLLCGTAVVLADSSSIPEAVLSLPGVFRYRTGSLEDFVRRTEEALMFMRGSEGRRTIAAAAAVVLDGAALRATLRRELGLGKASPR